jgi:predicted alpha/beta superfamily hydrolase
MRRRWSFSCAAGLALALAACGSSPPPSTTPDASAPVDAAPPPVDAAIPDAAPPPSDLDRLDALVAALGTAATEDARDALAAAFAKDVAYGVGGFPIRETGTVTFVFWDRKRTGGPWSVAGDFDAWSTTATPMMRPVATAPLWIAKIADPMPKGRSLYKLVRAGTEFVADPWARRHGYDGFGEFSLLEAGTSPGHLERWPAFSEKRGTLEARTLTVWVPPGYDPKSAAGYPTLVMHDGQNLFGPGGGNGSWHVDDAAEQGVSSGALRPFLVVAIPNSARRFDEYTHVKDSIPNLGTYGGAADEYATFVVDGIVPFVRARYRARTEAAETAILGSSLGGLISLYVARKHPTVFGYAGSLSGTISWGKIGLSNPTIHDLYVQSAPKGLVLYVDSGGRDGGGCGTLSHLDSELYFDQYCESRAFKDMLLGKGWVAGTDLFYAWAPNATHDEAAWAARLPAALAGWFPKK